MNSAIARFFTVSNAFDFSAENDVLFVEAMREAIAHHRAHNAVFGGICRQAGYDETALCTPEDALRVPHIIVSAFKEMKLLSVPESEIVRTFTSSGTGGTKSQTFMDQGSFDRQAFMRRSIVESYGLAAYDEEVNTLCFSYDPASSGQRGAAHTHNIYAQFAKSREIVYAIAQGEDGEPHFRLDDCVAALERFAASGLPLRVTGFPAFGYVTLKALRERGESFRFPPESVMFSGGGWKLHTGIAISNQEYAALVEEVLGISGDRIRDVYGMVEHGVPYLTDEHGQFRVPIYGRVCAVDPGTLEILPDGETGLLKLVTPYITSIPALSVLSTDLGAVYRYDEEGRYAPRIVLKGRGGVKKYDGCAISAAQLLGQ